MGSAESERYDQMLDSVLVGPVVRGSYRFVFQVRGGGRGAPGAGPRAADARGGAAAPGMDPDRARSGTRAQVDPPDHTKLPDEDIVGVTVILLTCSYQGKEFIRVGYYVNNEYIDEDLRENPPATPAVHRLARNILADKPRVTKFPIDFDPPAFVQPAGQFMGNMQAFDNKPPPQMPAAGQPTTSFMHDMAI